MFTVADIRKRYGVSEPTVLTWIRTGAIKAINITRTPGAKRATWRITQAAIDAFELARTTTQPRPITRRQKPAADVVEFYK